MLVRRLRREARSVDLPFRCDGPEVRRELNLRVAPISSGRLVLFAARLRSEERRSEFQPLLAAATPRTPELLVMCGWCDRFLVGQSWVEVGRRPLDWACSSSTSCRRSVTASAPTAARC
jgi:hypothetical protein